MGHNFEIKRLCEEVNFELTFTIMFCLVSSCLHAMGINAQNKYFKIVLIGSKLTQTVLNFKISL